MWSRHSCRCPWAAGRRGRRHKAPPPAEPPAAPGANSRGAEEEERPHPARGCARGRHGAGRGKGQGAHRPEAGGGGGGGEGGSRGLPAVPGTSAAPGDGCWGCPVHPGLCSPPVSPQRLKGDGPREPPAVERMSTPELEEEKRQGPRNRGIEAIKVRAGCGDRGAGGHGGDERGAACPRRARSGCGGARWTCAGRSSTWGAYSASSSCASSAASAGRSGRPPPSPRRRRSPSRSYVQGLPKKPGCPGGAGHGAPCCPHCPSPALPCPQEGPVEPETFLRAAVQGKIRVIEKFLADGGPPDTCDEFHRTALHRSSLEGHTDILQKLLDSGATVDFRDRLDCTAVHWACRGGHLDAVKLLQDHGADLNLKDKLLSTPLHVATRTGHPDIVEHLIHCGVDINSPDRVRAGPRSQHGGQRRAPSEGCHAALPGVMPSAWPGLGRAPSPCPLGDVGAQTEPGCVSRRRGTRRCTTPRASAATRSSRC
uniref:Ankyrin repeat domain 2 n=1 Tax=Anser brachyrhynchus TaxID=132585 RepID=A0A8B9BU57_9AVES